MSSTSTNVSIEHGMRVHILPSDELIEGLSVNIFDIYLKPYFLEGKVTISV